MRIARVISTLLIGLLLALIACASPSTAPQLPKSTSTSTWIDQANRAWVVAHSYNWDADSEDDGLRVWVELQNANENAIEYSKADMPVDIKIYSTESKTYPWKPARIIYSGSGLLTNWDDDAFVTGAKGINDISWEEISHTLPSEQQEYGIILVDITLPDGKNFSAQDEARIKP